MKVKQIKDFILGLEGVMLTQPFGKNKLVFSAHDQMFAILDKDKIPLRISLRCEAELSELLREKYDEVMSGDHLDGNAWNTIILSGQLEDDEIQVLIRHSYNLMPVKNRY
jgi:predicted DNA-binding protein (MmcQ/YjbR family)